MPKVGKKSTALIEYEKKVIAACEARNKAVTEAERVKAKVVKEAKQEYKEVVKKDANGS